MSGEAPSNTWARLLARLEPKVGPHYFSTWFRPTQFLAENDGQVTVQVPNDWFANWLESNYGTLINEILAQLDKPAVRIRFVPQDGGTPASALAPAVAATPGHPAMPCASINPRYTFDSFVVSSCNQFAHAAASAVSEQPKRAYNPLYIYGGVGLGKTHLMQAIGNRVGSRGVLNMCYMAAEHFMNEMINAIRFEKTLEFRNRFRNVDLLLIDDVQFLAGRERTQEEFFHTFNALYDAQKQIVITSDLPPRQLPTIEDRLRSRFEWGLIADIQPPDLETKVAILRKKAEAENCLVPDEVALFIASKCNSNIRELEGALVRVIAYGSMVGRSLTLELAREHLRDFGTGPSTAATTESIQKMVANHYKLRVGELKTRNNSPQIALPRQIAMYLCKEMTEASLPEIGRRFGGKHHSTVIHSIRKIARKRTEEKEFDKLVQHFMQALQ